MSKNVLILPGDGIGPEIVTEARRVLELVNAQDNLGLEITEALVGGAAIDADGVPLPEATKKAADAADAILLGAVGGPKWDTNPDSRFVQKRVCWAFVLSLVYLVICVLPFYVLSWRMRLL
jgi:3-isopropylmalate dehydrogenase